MEKFNNNKNKNISISQTSQLPAVFVVNPKEDVIVAKTVSRNEPHAPKLAAKLLDAALTAPKPAPKLVVTEQVSVA